ncbi:MAG TPA: hypothetical protein VHT73_11920 [Thermodesulfobacteriota bacterium]|nr:hypothetical protein [Thermodesulfobacteriota bacterium]
MANKRHIRIKDLRDAKRLLVKLINERRRDETESQEIRDVGYLIRIFVETYTKGELSK